MSIWSTCGCCVLWILLNFSGCLNIGRRRRDEDDELKSLRRDSLCISPHCGIFNLLIQNAFRFKNTNASLSEVFFKCFGAPQFTEDNYEHHWCRDKQEEVHHLIWNDLESDKLFRIEYLLFEDVVRRWLQLGVHRADRDQVRSSVE